MVLIWRRYDRAQMPQQIAAEIGWKVNAVRVALTRARGVLRQCMEKRLKAMGQPG